MECDQFCTDVFLSKFFGKEMSDAPADLENGYEREFAK